MREPASRIPAEPAPRTTAVPAVRTSVHSPRATRMRMASTVPGGGPPGDGGHDIHATPRTDAMAQTMRDGRPLAHHANETSATQAAHAHHGGSCTATVAPGMPAAARAIHANAAAPDAANHPQATPIDGTRPASTALPTPATVVAAAIGMVSTLSGTASIGTDPPCAAATGMLAVHATAADTTATTAASATSPVASAGFRRVAAAIVPRTLRHHRPVGPEESRRSASTTP